MLWRRLVRRMVGNLLLSVQWKRNGILKVQGLSQRDTNQILRLSASQTNGIESRLATKEALGRMLRSSADNYIQRVGKRRPRKQRSKHGWRLRSMSIRSTRINKRSLINCY